MEVKLRPNAMVWFGRVCERVWSKLNNSQTLSWCGPMRVVLNEGEVRGPYVPRPMRLLPPRVHLQGRAGQEKRPQDRTVASHGIKLKLKLVHQCQYLLDVQSRLGDLLQAFGLAKVQAYHLIFNLFKLEMDQSVSSERKDVASHLIHTSTKAIAAQSRSPYMSRGYTQPSEVCVQSMRQSQATRS